MSGPLYRGPHGSGSLFDQVLRESAALSPAQLRERIRLREARKKYRRKRKR